MAVSSQRCDVAQPEPAAGPEVSLLSAEGAVRLQDQGVPASAASGRRPLRLPVHVTPGAQTPGIQKLGLSRGLQVYK